MTKTYEATGTVTLKVEPGNGSPVLTIDGQGGYWDGTINGTPSKDVLYISNVDGENWGGLLDALRRANVLPADATIDSTEREGAWASHYSDEWLTGLDGWRVEFATRQVIDYDEEGEITDIGEIEWIPKSVDEYDDDGVWKSTTVITQTLNEIRLSFRTCRSI